MFKKIISILFVYTTFIVPLFAMENLYDVPTGTVYLRNKYNNKYLYNQDLNLYSEVDIYGKCKFYIEKNKQ